MVLPHNRSHHHRRRQQQQLDVDAIPMLQARDELPLLYQDDHMHLLSRRKRHSGGEYSSSNATSANIAGFVRRRGRSVPCDARDAASAGSSATADADATPFVRTRAGSAAAALSGRRRAASSILQHFRRRKDDAQSQEQSSRRHQHHAPLGPQQQQRARRRVHFKTALHAEVIPNRHAHLQSYDELLFNVGGLYQTLSFLHDPLPVDDAGSSSTDSNSSHALGLDDLLPPERSMQLMIAEFLYRSAVYLGYACENKPWIPGFRELKRFSVNDVKRWRRLAHYDWEQEEQRCDAMRLRNDSNGSSNSSSNASGSGRLRAVVSSWLQRRRHSAPAKMTRAMNSPPPVPPTTDLSLLVTIANSCIYCGTFQFSTRDIRILCNVDIESKAAPAAA